MIQDAVLRNLHTLTESAGKLSKRLLSRYPQIDWSGVIGFRNVVVHDYLGIDLDITWKIVKQDLPALRKAVREMLAEI
jgi:uncharacterized protein with HEPN domain